MIFMTKDDIFKSMRQNDNNKKSKDEARASAEYKIQNKEDWLDEHGSPSFDFLQSLADSGNLEKLRSIASDLNAEYSHGDSADELIDAIRSAKGSGPKSTTT